MKLITKELRKIIPPLYAQENKGGNAILYAKFFDPCSNWTWYVMEFDGEDTLFGLVEGVEKELGYFSLKELETTHNAMGLTIERDLYFKPKPIREVVPEWYKEETR